MISSRQNSWERGTTSIHVRVTSRLYAFGLPARPEGSTPKSLSRVLYVSDRWRAAPRIDRQMSGGNPSKRMDKGKAAQRPMLFAKLGRLQQRLDGDGESFRGQWDWSQLQVLVRLARAGGRSRVVEAEAVHF